MVGIAYIAILVALAYGLFFLYDLRTVKNSHASQNYLFFVAGCLLNVVAAGVFFANQIPSCSWDAIAFLALAGAGVCFALVVWALFFALPKNTYVDPEAGRPVYNQGMYALCRHPGVLWYCGLFLFAAIAFRTPSASISAVVLCSGNIAYMFFQDWWSFPRTFNNYQEYQDSVPFFFPTPSSFRRAFASTASGGEGL